MLQRFFPVDTPRFLLDPVACHQIDPVKELLIDIGFDPIVIAVQRHVYEIADISAFARALIYSPVLFEIRDRGGVNPEDIAAALPEAFRQELGTNPTRYPMQAILFDAVNHQDF